MENKNNSNLKENVIEQEESIQDINVLATSATATRSATKAAASSDTGADPFSKAEKYKSFQLFDGVATSVNLANKNYVTQFNDFNGLLGLNISHMYIGTKSENDGYGKGFSLNICETLTDPDSSTININTTNFVYKDAFGDVYKLEDGTVKDLYLSQVPKNIKSYYELITKSVTDLGELYRREPVVSLTNGSITRSFNEYGNLVFINDNYRHIIHIIYDVNFKVKQITNYKNCYKQGKTTVNLLETFDFTYNANGDLQSIKKGSDTLVTCSYTNRYLKTISYNTGITYELSYVNNKLSTIASEDYISTINMGTDVKIDVKSRQTKMPEGSQTTANPVINSWSVSGYNTATRKITDIDNDAEYYMFDTNGNLTEYREEMQSLITYAEQYTYDDSNNNLITRKVAKAKASTLNASDNENYKFTEGETEETVYNQYKQIKLVERSNIPVTAHQMYNTFTYYEYDSDHKLTRKRESLYLPESEDNIFLFIEEYEYKTDYEGDLPKLSKKTRYEIDEYLTKGKTVEEYTYDDYANVIKTVSYNTLSPSDQIISEKEYKVNGNLINETNIEGDGCTTYGYDEKNRVYLASYPISNSLSGKMYYGYDAQSRINAVTTYSETYVDTDTETEVITESTTNNITYANGELVQMKCRKPVYNYEYDEKRRLAQVKVDGKDYESYTYEDGIIESEGKYNKVTKTNAKGETFTVTNKVMLDENEKYIYRTEILEYSQSTNQGAEEIQEIQEKQEQVKITDKLNNSITTINYDYCGNMQTYNYSASGRNYKESISYYGDASTDSAKLYGLVKTVTMTGLVSRTDTYTYNEDSTRAISKYETGAYTVIPYYDRHGRMNGKSVIINGSFVEMEDISYYKNGVRMSDRVIRKSYAVGTDSEIETSYTYYNSGNLSSADYASYEYDGYGRLKRENNKALTRTYVYTYDIDGNILKKSTYSYSTTDILANGTSITYVYTDGKLTSYNGQSCVYDALGNPTTYRGKTASWTRGRLMTAYDGTTFDYDATGRRIKKNNITYTYDSNGRVIKQSNELEFYYDMTGILGMKYNSSYYYYRKDVLGNVIAILDNDGNVVVEYYYDAWGNHKITGNTTLGNLNPFRYRGYYFDSETGFYFLQTRYYDPEVGRFLNMDSIDYADPNEGFGLNLYAYCCNNPVMYVDPTGYARISISQIVDFMSCMFEFGIGCGLSLVGWTIKSGVRPSNIGIGVYNKYITSQIANLSKASGILSKISTCLAIASVGLNVIEGIYCDVNKGYEPSRIISNAATNIIVYGGLTFGSGAVGAKLGAMAGSVVPGLGNVVGAAIGFVLGITVGFILDLKIGDKSIIEHIQDGVYNIWQWIFGG